MCCLRKEKPKEGANAVAGVLYGPFESGGKDDFYNRFWFQNSEIRSCVIPKEKQTEFDEDYLAVVQNLLEAKYAKNFCKKYIEDHLHEIAEGKDGTVSGHQINVKNQIDIELNMFFKDFFIRGRMATEGLLKLINDWLGYKIGFLFSDDQKVFNKGVEKFKLDASDPRFQTLDSFIKSHREGWYRKFIEIRDEIEHHGLKLPQIKHRLGSDGKVEAVFPKIGDQSIQEVLEVLWFDLSYLCEEIFVFVMSLEIKKPYIIWQIPEDKREQHNWVRYKIALPQFPEARVSIS